MSQRNPMNERYREENRGGKTRKSAASAKPSAERAATLRDPAPKTKKQKKEEARERERKREQRYAVQTPDNKRIEDLPEYKRLRKRWWGCLIGAIVLIVLSFVLSQNTDLLYWYVGCIVGGYALVIYAFYIDFGKIRKLRKKYEQDVLQGKSKEARAAQKKARAEARAQQKEAEEKDAAAKVEEQAKKETGFFGRFRKKPKAEDAEESVEEPASAEAGK